MSPTPAEREKLAAESTLTSAKVAAIDRKLDKLDAGNPWTRRTLELIGEQPGVVSGVLARQVHRDRYGYRGMVRELLDLGLIYSLEVGYSLSPRGRAYLRAKTGTEKR